MTLIIGNKNYSSWSMRPWIAMRQVNVSFAEQQIGLGRPESRQAILRYSPSGRVPCLIDGDLTVFDSLAICEYINEAHAAQALWPTEPAARARARAVTAEMHSGFAALRTHMPMDIRARNPERGATALAREDVAADIARIQAVWTECLSDGGPMLFGRFSIADAFFAPVVTRFDTYGVRLSPLLAAYSETVLMLPAMQQWIAAAKTETATIEN
ncbi:MAG: glutathione S-transferase family protein [Burkholderiaceae bacterium]